MTAPSPSRPARRATARLLGAGLVLALTAAWAAPLRPDAPFAVWFPGEDRRSDAMMRAFEIVPEALYVGSHTNDILVLSAADRWAPLKLLAAGAVPFSAAFADTAICVTPAAN